MDILGLLFDGIHYLIGMIIVCLLVCTIIKLHNHYSKDNIVILVPPSAPPNSAIQSQSQSQLSVKNKV
jgi:hypothetical protein